MSDSTDLNGQQVCERVEDLIGAWCDQRTLKALRIVLPAWPPSGLTDDWHALLDALRGVRARAQLTDSEKNEVGILIAALNRLLHSESAT